MTRAVVTDPVSTRRRASTCPATFNAAATRRGHATTASAPLAPWSPSTTGEAGPARTTSRNEPDSPRGDETGMADSDNGAPGGRRVFRQLTSYQELRPIPGIPTNTGAARSAIRIGPTDRYRTDTTRHGTGSKPIKLPLSLGQCPHGPHDEEEHEADDRVHK